MSKEKPKASPAFPENWREIDHPFYKLVKDILAGKGATEFVDPSSLTPDLDFWTKEEQTKPTAKSAVIEKYGRPEIPWSGNIPEEIVIATGSTRKAFMMSVVLNSLEVPLEHAMDFQEFMIHSIYNGDGSLKGKTFLGEFHGVPVFAESAAAGETIGNNPKAEALNKARWMAEQPQYKGKNVLILSTDTVDFLDRDDNGEISNGEEGLGKPMNHQDYPTKNWLMKSKVDFLKRMGEKIFSLQEEAFFREYIKENFVEGLNLVHTNAVALLELMSSGDEEILRVWQAVIRTEIDQEFFDRYKPVIDQGGGGASQQNQDWESVENIFASLDEKTQQILAPIKENDPEFFKFLVIFQISGMPAMNILKSIENWAEQQKASLSQKEVVVFASE